MPDTTQVPDSTPGNSTPGTLFGAHMKRLRLDRGLSLRAAERAVGVSNSYLYQIERGERGVPTMKTLMGIASGYGVGLDSLLAAAGSPVPETDTAGQHLDNAFLLVCRDPDYATSAAVEPSAVPPEVKRFVVEIYERANGLRLVKTNKDKR